VTASPRLGRDPWFAALPAAQITDVLAPPHCQRWSMPGRSIRIARIAGIPVEVSPLWLIVVGLITWSLGAGYYPAEVRGITPAASYALGLASALLLFASILAHEFGHAVTARRRGMPLLGVPGNRRRRPSRRHAERRSPKQDASRALGDDLRGPPRRA
jgi:hypothetical protein